MSRRLVSDFRACSKDREKQRREKIINSEITSRRTVSGVFGRVPGSAVASTRSETKARARDRAYKGAVEVKSSAGWEEQMDSHLCERVSK